ncbi:MAG: hypothetical protein Q4C54_08220 [Clostridia bacterium]|nr:hypothetical protein [Clostridia bacterium]
MVSLLYLAVYLFCGIVMVRWLLPRHPVLNRLWLGCSAGLLMMMWLPALCAYVLRFSVTAHMAALGLLALVTFLCYLGRDKRPVRPWDEKETAQLRLLVIVVLPLTFLSAFLQYTHNFRIAADGSWHVGQSTYGDLPMHTSFITGMVNSTFPPEYSFYPGHKLSYPYLTDSLSSTFYLFGMSLQLAICVPGTLMMLLCFAGVMLLAREMTTGKKAALLATLLFFLNGGLGFLYDFDQAAGRAADGSSVLMGRLNTILTGFYKTPTNQPDPNNLRWSNVIVDMMIPQRTLLGGWCVGIPCFYLLYTAFDPHKREHLGGLRARLMLGVWAGLLPLVHTHTFLALGLCSAGMLVYDLIAEKGRKDTLLRYLPYALCAVVLAAPQLILDTFAQTFQSAGAEGSGNSFLRLQFNWVNNPNGQGMRDFYLWFYIKNIGLPFILLVLALFERDSRQRRMFAGALAIILAAELVRFQPNEYDNNKLFYLAWLICAMVAANYCAVLWHRLQGLRGRKVMAFAAAVVMFLSAGLTIARECVSDYQAFSRDSVAAGMYFRDNTPEDAMVLTGTQHLNPVNAIAGRRIVCGPDLWLYWHGFNTTERKLDLADFYADPAGSAHILQKYGVDYIYVSSYERSEYEIDMNALNALYPVIFSNNEATVWQVPEG